MLEPARIGALFPSLGRSQPALNALQHRVAERGERLISEGSSGPGLILLLEGRVGVDVELDGIETRAGELGPGDIAGEVSVIDGGPASATVTASTRVEYLLLTREALDALERLAPPAASAVLHVVNASLARRLRTATERFEQAHAAAAPPAPRQVLLGLLLGVVR